MFPLLSQALDMEKVMHMNKPKKEIYLSRIRKGEIKSERSGQEKLSL